MEQKILKAELKAGNLRNIYLLYGEERYLVNHYLKEIEKTAGISDKTVFDAATPASEIILAAETLPFTFSGEEKRLIVVRESGLCAMKKKDEEPTEKKGANELADYVAKVPPDTVLIFIESSVDRRTKLYKKIAEQKGVFEFKKLTQAELAKWLTQIAKKSGKVLPPECANALITTCGTDMHTLENETKKLLHYTATNPQITVEHIRNIATPTLESRVFDLTKAIGTGNTKTALKMYAIMLQLKESPFMVLSMIIRQLRMILLCKCHAEKGTPTPQIMKELGVQYDFIIREALSMARRFTKERLIAALYACQETDHKIKQGLLEQEIGVEMLIIECAA